MLDYRFLSLCRGHIQLILLGDVYVGSLGQVSLWRPPSLNIIIRRCLCCIIDSGISPSVYTIIRRCLCWVIESSLFMLAIFSYYYY